MQNKINGIVFSRDRAAQLKLFLDSVNKHAPDVFDLNVIISHTSEEFDKGYGKVVHDPTYQFVNFVGAEPDFKEQVLGLMKTEHEYSCFFLDDDLIYKDVKLDEIISQLESDDDVACFSLRLGENVTKCYTLGAENVMHDIKHDGNIMKWDWSLHYLDFGYPFAMDGHIFRRADIFKLVKKSKFTGVEELEMALFDFAEMFPRNMMVSYKHSALVGVPIGRVQQSIDNEMAVALAESRARLMRVEMNTKFLDGDFINLEAIDFSEVNGCHQDLDLGVELKKQEENE
jgi:hypothetical protein